MSDSRGVRGRHGIRIGACPKNSSVIRAVKETVDGHRRVGIWCHDSGNEHRRDLHAIAIVDSLRRVSFRSWRRGAGEFSGSQRQGRGATTHESLSTHDKTSQARAASGNDGWRFMPSCDKELGRCLLSWNAPIVRQNSKCPIRGWGHR